MRLLVTLTLLLIVFPGAYSQEPARPKTATEPIADNSFLIEEAYNQETGVVQHINTFTRMRNSEWLYTFTEEWPIRSIKHQLSYTLPLQRLGDPHGVGDILINYRYQLAGTGDSKVAVAPRLSVSLPTGSVARGLGAGGWGIQTNLPLSVVMSKQFVTHWNAGVTLVPAAKNGAGQKAFTRGYNLGQSIVWLTKPRFNVLMETAWTTNQSVTGNHQTAADHRLYLSPGIRWAHNFKSGLQVVPGVAFPIGIGPSKRERGVFFYLSFEHPFKHVSKSS